MIPFSEFHFIYSFFSLCLSFLIVLSSLIFIDQVGKQYYVLSDFNKILFMSYRERRKKNVCQRRMLCYVTNMITIMITEAHQINYLKYENCV